MYAPINQPPDVYFDVSNIQENVTVLLGLYDNADMVGSFFLTEMFSFKNLFLFLKYKQKYKQTARILQSKCLCYIFQKLLDIDK